MPTQFKTLSFNGGLNTDLDKSLRDGSSYLRAENFSYTSIDGGTLGTLENSKSNELDPTVSFEAGHQIVGYVNVVRNTVYFTSNGTDSNIYYHTEGSGTLLKFSDASSTSKLNFSLDSANRIVGVGRQELADLEKVYWVDGINELRYIDLSRNYIGGEATEFNVIPPNDLTATIDAQAVAGAGNYNAGTVYYAYQFYTLNGASSTISQSSIPVKLSEFTGIKDGGIDKGENSNCAVEVNINNIDQTVLDQYNRIRLYVIFYEDIASPVVNIVSEKSLSNTSISFIDTGENQSGYTLEEFTSANQTSYIPEAIASKDNILFIGNLKENTFSDTEIDNWDARAYRFDDSNVSYIWDATETDYIIVNNTTFLVQSTNIVGLNPGDPIPEDFDCRNKYNNTYTNSLENRAAFNNYRYKTNGTTIGGEGINVSYEFQDLYKSVDTNAAGGIREDKTFTQTNQSEIYYTDANRIAEHGLHIECEPGEVYRVGIRFFNEKGQSSFVKWVGDILWEEAGYTKCSLNITDDDAVSLSKALKITISNIPSSATSWQIVRAKRDEVDRSVMASGQLRQTAYDSVDDLERPDNFNAISANQQSKKLYRFISPELMYNSAGINAKIDNYKLRVYNKSTDLTQDSEVDTGSGDGWGQNGKQSAFARKFNGIEPRVMGTGYTSFTSLDGYRWGIPIHEQDNITDRAFTVNGYEYLNQYGRTLFNGADDFAAGCSTMVISNNEELGTDSSESTETTNVMYASLISNKETSRYGGITYQDIQNTTYVPFSNVVEVGTTTSVADYGDTYTLPFYYMEALFYDRTGDSKDSGYILASFITTSRIDLRRRNDRLLDYVNGLDSILGSTSNDDGYMHPQETVEKGIEFQGTTYDTTIGDLYIYNPVYSAENSSMPSFSKPFDFIESQHSTTKVLASEKKINGEAEDQWTNFLPNNFIEVDTAFGSLNTLNTFDNHLFFWQDRAFGTLAVNHRSLISDQSGSQLALGTGGILERYDYISQEVGNVDKYNVERSENAIFWTYSPKSNIYLFDNQLKEISTSEGVKAYLESKGTIVDPITIVDTISNETLFKLNDEVLVYDFMLGKFVSINTFDPNWFIRMFNGNYKSSGDSQTVYIHNSTDLPRATYYTTTYPSTIKHICSDNYNYTKVFDNLEWHSTSLDSAGVNQFTDTFTSYRMYNDYQNTDWQSVTYERDERSFKSFVPRDIVDKNESTNADIFNVANLDSTQLFKRRMRDKYLILDFSYNNNNSYKFSIPFVNLLYRISAR